MISIEYALVLAIVIAVTAAIGGYLYQYYSTMTQNTVSIMINNPTVYYTGTSPDTSSSTYLAVYYVVSNTGTEPVTIDSITVYPNETDPNCYYTASVNNKVMPGETNPFTEIVEYAHGTCNFTNTVIVTFHYTGQNSEGSLTVHGRLAG